MRPECARRAKGAQSRADCDWLASHQSALLLTGVFRGVVLGIPILVIAAVADRYTRVLVSVALHSVRTAVGVRRMVVTMHRRQ